MRNFYDIYKLKLDKIPCRYKIYKGIYNYGFHGPYTKYMKLTNPAVITAFRNPTDRLISAFLFGDIMIPLGMNLPKFNKTEFNTYI